jgi:hypothetical protein
MNICNKRVRGLMGGAVLLGLAVAPSVWAAPQEAKSAPAVKRHAPAPKQPAATAKTPAVAAPAAEEPLQAEQLAVAEQVQTGNIPCELGARIKLVADAAKPGYFDLEGQGYRYRLHPVVSRTGAIRLEDVQRGAVWIQLANKSMLMDQKNGRRLADECMSERQMAVAEAYKKNPPQHLLGAAAPN